MRLLLGTKHKLRDVTNTETAKEKIQYMQLIADEVNVKNVVESHPQYEPEVRLVLETDPKFPYEWK